MQIWLVSLVSALALAFAAPAQAEEGKTRKWKKNTQVETQRGTYEGSKSVERGKGWRNTQSTRTGPGGKSVETETGQSWGKTDTGFQSSGGGTRTYDDGSTASRDWQREIDTQAKTRTKSGEREFRDGTTASGSSEVTKTGEGQYDYNKTYTNRDGEEYSKSGTVTITKDED